MTSRTWIDISVPIDEHTAVFPETPGIGVRRLSNVEKGDEVTLSELRLSTHSATHVDAPLHFLAGGAGVDSLDLDALNGPARVLDLTDCDRVGAEELAGHGVDGGERLLLKTANSMVADPAWHRREFDPDYAHLAADGARHLVEQGAAAIGIDYLSIGGEGRDNVETHRILLGAGVAILEGCALEDVEPGSYELRCLPLLIPDGDGAPARALLGAGAPED